MAEGLTRDGAPVLLKPLEVRNDLLDRVRFIVPGDAGEKAANGTCSLGNLDKGVPATIECRAITEAGTFDGTFVTNGSKPTLAAN